MKQAVVFLACLGLLLCHGVSTAQERATKEECIAKCKEAAVLIKEVGFETAKTKLQDPHGAFVWKDGYVLVMDLNHNILAHPVMPQLVGKNFKGAKDFDGKAWTYEMVEIATTKGEGWVEHSWPKPGEKVPSHKVTYVYRVPGENMLVAAGIYE